MSNLFFYWPLSAGAVLYRLPVTWGQNKLPWKLLHAALMLLALLLSIVGLCAVFQVHNAEKYPNLYSLHSWIGITATALFAMQVHRGGIISFNPNPSIKRGWLSDITYMYQCLSLLWSIQWVVGAAGFLLPCSPVSLRKLLKPIHVWLGGSILLLSIAASVSGINEKLFFVL